MFTGTGTFAARRERGAVVLVSPPFQLSGHVAWLRGHLRLDWQ